MRVKIFSIVLILFAAFASNIRADTYSTFQTTRYYSANRSFFVIVNKNKRATLYQNGSKLHRVWRKTLSYLPNKLFVTNDGKRVVIVDSYYGNNGSSSLPVIIFLDENGKQFASHLLGDVANLKRVLQTTSSAHWYKDIRLSSDEQNLLIETLVRKLDSSFCERVTSAEQAEQCMESVAFQELHFVLSTGELIERKQLASN